jgi:hypothetical protein
MGDRVQGRRRNTTITEDISESIGRLAKLPSGLLGNASRSLSGRQMQIDDAIEDAVNGAHDRQHTDKANR